MAVNMAEINGGGPNYPPPGKLTWNTMSWRYGSDDFPCPRVDFRFQPLIFRGVQVLG